MAERETCIFCRRELATDEDWKHPAMEHDEPHAELDALCWDPGDSCGQCILVALDKGLPANYEDAAAALYRAERALEFIADHYGPAKAAGEMARAALDPNRELPFLSTQQQVDGEGEGR